MPGSDIPAIDRLFDKKGRGMVIAVHAGSEFVISGCSQSGAGMSLSITIAAPFRHTRKERLKKNEIVYYLAFERGWMNIEQATMLLSRAREEGLIEYEGEMIRPLFDVGAVEIPLGFKPTASVFRKSDPQEELMQRIATGQNIPLTTVAAETNILIRQDFDGHIRPEAALVILARRYHIPFDDLLPSLRETIVKK
jgi:hypothetical protein